MFCVFHVTALFEVLGTPKNGILSRAAISQQMRSEFEGIKNIVLHLVIRAMGATWKACRVFIPRANSNSWGNSCLDIECIREGHKSLLERAFEGIVLAKRRLFARQSA